MEKLRNFWFYYHKHLLIALAVVLIAGYLSAQDALAPKPDYHIGLVQSLPCTEEALSRLEADLAAVGEDENGDGEVLVQIHTYFVDLADTSESAYIPEKNPVAALDADLVGRVSGIFLLEDVEAFRSVTGEILAEGAVPFGDSLYLTVRRDASDADLRLFENLS